MLVSLHCVAAPGRVAEANIVWENYGFTDGQAIAGGTTFAASGGTGVTIGRSEFSDNDGGTFDLTPGGNADFATFQAGELGAHLGYLELSFDNENDDPVDYVEFSLNFDSAVTDLQFSLLDIDGNRSRDDAVEVYYNGTNNVRDNPAILALTGPYVIPDLKPYMHGWESIGRNAGSGQTRGNIDFVFGSLAITSLTIRYFSTDDPRPNPSAQQIGLSDLAFTEAVPEASTLGCLIVFAVVVLLGQANRTIRLDRDSGTGTTPDLATGSHRKQNTLRSRITACVAFAVRRRSC